MVPQQRGGQNLSHPGPVLRVALFRVADSSIVTWEPMLPPEWQGWQSVAINRNLPSNTSASAISAAGARAGQARNTPPDIPSMRGMKAEVVSVSQVARCALRS